ncbi:MAG: molybdopterin-dependent oxidoreductase [Anaerolineae bacterium]|nr:molybdopterin-dependent oxidoreductase [Anaerolineae bacterium]
MKHERQAGGSEPSAAMGALIGVLVTAPTIALQYLGASAFGLPFPPFDAFDWLARILPGNVVTAGIDALVGVIAGLNLGETSATAKALEQTLAVALFLGLGLAAGALLFALQGRLKGSLSIRLGLAAGMVAGALMIALYLGVNQTATATLAISVMWLLAVSVGWGGAIGQVHARLRPTQAVAVELPVISAAPSDPAGSELRLGPPVETGLINRRQFLLRVGGTAAVITVVGAGLGTLLKSEQSGPQPAQVTTGGDRQPALPANLPNAGDPLQPAPGTRPEYTPLDQHYRIDINLIPPSVSAEGWVLPVDGLVAQPLRLTLDDLRTRYPLREQYVTLSCISNPVGGDLIGTTLWTGASLQDILAEARPLPEAAYLRITAADGFDETVALDLIRADARIMLCYAWDSQPLTVEHGFPLRIYIPDLYGMKQPKWITAIQVVADYEEGYWVRRGWDEVARMQTTAVIDTIAARALIEEGGRLLVPVGGIAHAGARGISRVEVRVDDGPWEEARVRAPLSETTWVIWRYDWPFQEGQHIFAVRAYDGDGVMQESEPRGPRPSGATGIHSRSATLE